MLVCFNCILKLLSSLFIILPFLFTGANCEESSSRWTRYPVCSNGLWGYIDQQGELVLPYQWSYCGDFRGNGYALVCTKSGQYGIISSTGDYMIYPIPFADEAEELGYYGGKDTGVYWLDNGQNMGFFDVQSGFFSGYRYDLTQDLWFDAECSRSVLHMMVKPMDMSVGKTAFSKFPVYLNKSTQPVFITDSPLKTLHLPKNW